MIDSKRPNRVMIEKWTQDCLDVRFLKRKGFFDDGSVTIGGTLMWPRIARLRIAPVETTPEGDPVEPLRREMSLKTQFAEEPLGVGRHDFANGVVRIERKRDGDKAAHQVRVAVAPTMERPFPGRIRAIAELSPRLADAAADFIRTVVGRLA